jgi:hypothetical protein
MKEQEKKDVKRPYTKPKLRFARLIPQEAVMAVCKTSSGTLGIAQSACVVCKTVGS